MQDALSVPMTLQLLSGTGSSSFCHMLASVLSICLLLLAIALAAMRLSLEPNLSLIPASGSCWTLRAQSSGLRILATSYCPMLQGW